MSKIKNESFNVATNFNDFMNQREAVLFAKLPIPPSSNNQYFLLRKGLKTYHVPSNELKLFKLAMSNYAQMNCNFFEMNKIQIKSWIADGVFLEVRALFFFKSSRVLCKDGRAKKMDISNRLKALHDQLAYILDIDDSCFFKVYAEKCILESDNLNEDVCVEILPI